MKLNPDCIRAVMLEVEKTWQLDVDDNDYIHMGHIDIDELYQSNIDFDKADIFYSVYNLEQAGYLDVSIHWVDGGIAWECTINYMTLAGHKFLDGIRDEKNWASIKKGLNAIRNYSLDAISAVSKGVANATISTFVNSLNL